MTLIQKLDEVLNFITASSLWSELRDNFKEINKEELRIILRKLRKDGFVDFLDEGIKLRPWDDERGYNDQTVIQRNFEGDLFSQEGGYQGAYNKKNIESIRLSNLENIQQRSARQLNRVTGWIAGGTIALVIVEIIKFIYDR